MCRLDRFTTASAICRYGFHCSNSRLFLACSVVLFSLFALCSTPCFSEFARSSIYSLRLLTPICSAKRSYSSSLSLTFPLSPYFFLGEGVLSLVLSLKSDSVSVSDSVSAFLGFSENPSVFSITARFFGFSSVSFYPTEQLIFYLPAQIFFDFFFKHRKTSFLMKCNIFSRARIYASH